MRRLLPAELHAVKTAELGLDASRFDLSSPEAIASALRRAAAYLCPCPARTLVRTVTRPLDGLVTDLDSFVPSVEGVLEALVAHGDLIESPDIEAVLGTRGSLLLYVAPPSFVVRESGVVMILGSASSALSTLPRELETRFEYAEHVRRLKPLAGEDLRESLRAFGLLELTHKEWLGAPKAQQPASLISRFDQALDKVAITPHQDRFELLDPVRAVRYYRGRWVPPGTQSGRFVSRRPQRYGADLWCYAEFQAGQLQRFVDLPLVPGRLRGCDEAWRLQLAIDAQCGRPQEFRIARGTETDRFLEIFSPVPMWARRRWDSIGEVLPRTGCLFAYRFHQDEVAEERGFARDELWLAEVTQPLA